MKLNDKMVYNLTIELLQTPMPASNRKPISDYLRGARSSFPSRYGEIRSSLCEEWANRKDRTRSRYFHGLLFMQGWSNLLNHEGDVTSFSRVYRIIEQWRDAHAWSNRQDDSMAYHDETTAQRLNILLGLVSIENTKFSDNQLESIRQLCDETLNLLLSNTFHSGLNNHGMFQDIAIRNYSIVATWTSERERNNAFEISSRRLSRYFHHAFTEEGVHVENTPTYHLMVAKNLHTHLSLLQAAECPNYDLQKLYDSASEYATHVIMPNGMFPPISDTTKKTLRSDAGKIFDSQFAFACTAGGEGTKPNVTSKIFPKSGYAIYRSDWDSKDATYLLFQCAYNNDYHKHSDDLSFILYGHGREIITDSGPYSYNYSDSFSRYAYSQFSHNNIVVDRKSINRTDTKSKTVKIIDYGSKENDFSVTGETGRLDDVIHARKITVTGPLRNESILVHDKLSSLNRHQYTQNWNIACGLDVVLHGNGFEVFDGKTKILDAYITSDIPLNVDVRRGQVKPTVMGWSFPAFGEKVPSNVVSVSFEGVGDLEVKTKFEISNFSYKNRGLVGYAESSWQRYDKGRGINYLENNHSPGDFSIPLVFVFSAMSLPGDFTYNYKSTLDQVPCHAIYILDDFGNQGSYYLMEMRNNEIFDTVQNFITEKLSQYSGASRKVYFAGSSKGGTAALLHGLMIDNSNIYVGAPQTKIGSFLRNPHPNILEYMSGGTDDSDIDFLDSILYSPPYIRKNTSNVTIVIGKSDHHYNNHFLPWVSKMDKNGNRIEKIVLEGTPHSEIGKEYRIRLRSEILSASRSLDGNMQHGTAMNSGGDLEATEFGLYSAWFDPVSGILFSSCEPASGSEFSFRLFRGNEHIKSKQYQDECYAAWAGLPAGKYRVRFFRRDKTSQEVLKVTSKWVVI